MRYEEAYVCGAYEYDEDTDDSGKIRVDIDLTIGAAELCKTTFDSTCGAAVAKAYWVRTAGIASNPELMIVGSIFVVLVIVFKAIGAGEAFSKLDCHAFELKVASAGRKALNSGLVAILDSNFIGAASMMRAGSMSIAVRRIGAGVDTETNSEAVETIGDGVIDMMRAGSISTAVRMTGAGVEPVTR